MKWQTKVTLIKLQLKTFVIKWKLVFKLFDVKITQVDRNCCKFYYENCFGTGNSVEKLLWKCFKLFDLTENGLYYKVGGKTVA